MPPMNNEALPFDGRGKRARRPSSAANQSLAASCPSDTAAAITAAGAEDPFMTINHNEADGADETRSTNRRHDRRCRREADTEGQRAERRRINRRQAAK